MEENEDEPEDVRKATPVEEEIKRGEIDENSGKPTQSFVASTRKRHRCEKDISKKRAVKSEGECCRERLAKATRSPMTARVLVYEKKCTLPKIKVIPRHCLSKDEWIDILATPSRKCPPPCLQRAVTRKIRPVSARMAELAQPPKQRLLNTLQDRGGTLPTELLDNLIQTLEGETCLTPEQAERMFRDKDIRAKKKCRKRSKQKCKSNKSSKHTESGIASNISSFDKDAVHCQYLMAESFVKSILDWKCSIPREEFKDIAEVILKRMGDVLEYSPLNGEDRKSQQMRFLADIIASWISGVLFEVAEARKSELEEECERRRRAKEEETEEESDDETEDDSDDDDDEDDKRRPGGRGGPPRKGRDDKRKKDGKDGKDDDDDKKHGKPGKREDIEDKKVAGEVKDPAVNAPEESPSKPATEDQTSPPVTAQPQEKGLEAREVEVFHDARAEPETTPDVDEKKTSVTKPEDKKPEEKIEEEIAVDGKSDEKKEDTAREDVPKDSPAKPVSKSDDPSAKVEVLTAVANEEKDEVSPFEDLPHKTVEPAKIRDSVKGESEIGKRDDDKTDGDVTVKKSAEVLPGSEDKFGEINDKKKAEDAFVDYSQPLAEVKKSTERKSLEIGEALPMTIIASPEETAAAAATETSKVVESEKKIIDGLPADERAAGDKIDDKEIAEKSTKVPEAPVISEARREEYSEVSGIPVDSGDVGPKDQKDLIVAPPMQESSIPIAGEEEFRKEEEMKKSLEPSQDPLPSGPAEEFKSKEMELKEDDELRMKITEEPVEDVSIGVTGQDLQEKKMDSKEDDEPQTKTTVEPLRDPSIRVTAQDLEDTKMDLKEDDELQTKTTAGPLRDSSVRLTAEDLQDKKVDLSEDDDLKKVIDPSEDPSSLVTIEELRDKRKESERKSSPKKPSSSIAIIGKSYGTDVPFVTFDKIFHTIYNAIEASNENHGGDSITNRIHRAVYEKCSHVVQEENPGPLPALTRDVLDVMSGKIALWLRNVLTDSQLSFMNKFPATVESVEVREWSKWIGNVTDTATTWSTWIQQTIRQVEGMRTNVVTRGDWRDWTKSVETDALRWRRFYLESLHQAHQNLTMIRDRHVVKTGTKLTDEQKEEYEEEMKITDLEVER